MNNGRGRQLFTQYDKGRFTVSLNMPTVLVRSDEKS